MVEEATVEDDGDGCSYVNRLFRGVLGVLEVFNGTFRGVNICCLRALRVLLELGYLPVEDDGDAVIEHGFTGDLHR